ncbi:MAG: beta-lactamase family protein [Bacteroidales bacterium]|jgi:D-alanyl-D-alanine carboxypeptidase|nr:beta-lactamase family protein [Bacteroidales bacterium]
MRIILFFFLSFTILSPECYCQVILEDIFQKKLDDQVNDMVPGILAHIESPDRSISWSGASGFSDRVSKTKLNPSQSFRIASVTKTFVAATILRLWEDNRLSLDDLLAMYISNEHAGILSRGGYDMNTITLRHLLTHSSGLYDHAQSDEFMKRILTDPEHEWTRREQIESAIAWGKPVGYAGEKFSYSDTGYILLGEVIENITGKSLNDAIIEVLDLRGLGIKNTIFEGFRPPDREDRIHQYYNGIDTYDFNPSIDFYGGGGLISTTSDLAAFFQCLFNNKVFLNKSTLDTMLYQPQYESAPSMDYRIGIFRILINDIEAYTHTGFWGTQVVYIPSMNTTIAVNYSQRWVTKGPAPIISQILALLGN